MSQYQDDFTGSTRNRQTNQDIAKQIVSGGFGKNRKRSTARTVSGIPYPAHGFNYNTRTWNAGPSTSRLGNTPIGAQSAGLDSDTLAEVDRIRRLAQLELAEYRQRVEAENAQTENERIPVRRDIDIQDIFRQRVPGAITGEYGELTDALASVIPLTQQAYDEGVQNILKDYGVGITNQQGQATSADALNAQLQAMSGQTGGFEQGVEGTSDYIARILQNASAQGSQGLATEGAGVMGAIQSSLPGYGTERDQLIGDTRLSSEAETQNLLQQLALIQPDFLPFNYGELMTNTDQRIADAIRQGMDRQRAEQEEDQEGQRRLYSGVEGANMFALERDQPELVGPFMEMMNAASMSGNPDAIFAAIQEFVPEGATEIPEILRGRDTRNLLERGTGLLGGLLGGSDAPLNPFANQSSYRRPILNVRERREAQERRNQELQAARAILSNMARISQGQYSNTLMD